MVMLQQKWLTSQKWPYSKPNVSCHFEALKSKLYNAVLNRHQPLLEASRPIEEPMTLLKPCLNIFKTKLIISRDHPHASKVFANEVMSGAKVLPKEIGDEAV
ncbi:TetR family transcriptional regulator C-terminal domain-containing protein [Vibrio lentus]|nr:TetR family transcriptional regulator C-terminal domain-containing protein [Vibrio lentus]